MPERYRVLLTDRAWPDTQIESAILAQAGAVLIEAPGIREDQLRPLAAEADAIACNWAPLPASVISAASRCQIICRMGIGLDNIDVGAATARGIPVTNVPDYCIEEVAHHAVALLLACARQVAFFHRRTKLGEYRLQAAAPMPRLSGKVLGLVGLGRIGSRVARLGQALGMTVVANTASGGDRGTGCRILPLEELLAKAHFVSLHAPLTPETRHLLGPKQFGLMRSGAYLVNTSRGGLVDHDALWRAISRGQIAGAALDVFDPEPPDLDLPLFRDERVIVTPHAAFVSVESLNELRARVARQIVDRLEGRVPECVVNRSVLGAVPRATSGRA
jgi:D-3-phosphoglycerate dehydrogenase